MALLYDSRWRAIDASGNGYSGALLTVYDVGTTTPTSLFAEATLTTPLDNPVDADANGVFPQIFAAEGTVCDLVLTTAGGATLYEQENVAILGSDTGTLSRDFTNSRWRALGVGGEVSLEFGNATGDDVGGTGRIGGWDDTQADVIEIDAASFLTTGDLNVAGTLTEKNKKLGGIVQAASTTFTTQSTIDIALTNTPTGARKYVVEIYDLVTSISGNVALNARLAYDATPTFKTGASDYSYVNAYQDGSDTYDSSGSSSGGAAQILISGGGSGIYPNSTYPGYIRVEIVVTDSTGPVTAVMSYTVGQRKATTDGPAMARTFGFGLGGYGRATYLRIYPDSGTLSGKYRVFVERGFGE